MLPLLPYLPHIDAGLNALATLLLVLGWALIKGGCRRAHKAVMLSCFGVSVVFLGCYLTYHLNLPGHGKPFPREEFPTAAPFYFVLLISHVVLAAAVPVLAVTTIVFGLRGHWVRHKRWARWTFPIWLYVSVTGVLVYVLLYHVFVAPGASG